MIQLKKKKRFFKKIQWDCATENYEEILRSIISTTKAYIWQASPTFLKDNEHQAALS